MHEDSIQSLISWISLYQIAWHDRMLLSLQASKNWDIDEKAQKRKWGNFVHNVLAKINCS